MILKKVRIKNFKSIIDSGEIEFSKDISILAGQNESGKSSILEALDVFQTEKFDRDTVNAELEVDENRVQSITCEYEIDSYSSIKKAITKELKKMFPNQTASVPLKSISKNVTIYVTKSINHSEKKPIVSLEISQQIVSYYKSNILLKIPIKKSVQTKNARGRNVTSSQIVLTEIQIANPKALSDAIILGVVESTPKFHFINEIKDTLPDTINVSFISNKKKFKGQEAVFQFQKLIDRSLDSFYSGTEAAKRTGVRQKTKKITKLFEKSGWKQNLFNDDNLKISFDILKKVINNGQVMTTVNFFIESKDGIELEPRKRSKGLQSFLFYWLQLKAMEKDSKAVLLIDEPGLYLHLKAHKNLLQLFKEFTKHNHQLIYSTHSPSLIDTDRLSNIGLVINDEEKGTLVEKITSSKIDTQNKQDALQPVTLAMGMDINSGFGPLNKKNVLVEGISDMFYFQAFQKLLDIKTDYQFVPNVGIKGNKINSLISFCVGYGLEWLLIMEKGSIPQETKKNITKILFEGSESLATEKIHLIPFDEVEEMFTIKDLQKIDFKIKKFEDRTVMEVIGKKRKVIFAKRFSEKVNNGSIKLEDLAESTIANFKAIFDWIDSKFKKSK